MQHAVDPTLGCVVGVPTGVVEQWRNLLFEQSEKTERFSLVASCVIGVVLDRRNVPTVLAIAPFVPPAVANAAIERAVERGLHAAGSAGLVRPERVVQPNIAAVVHDTRDGDVVVGQEHEAMTYVEFASEELYRADHFLTRLIGRVRLPGEDELHRLLWMQQETSQPLRLREQESGSLICGEPPREANREHLRVEDVVTQPRAHVGHQTGPACFACGPHDIVRYAMDPRPRFVVGAIPDAMHFVTQQLVDFGRDPTVRMHAVGDVPDGDLVDRHVWPHAVEHRATDRTVQRGDTVGTGCEPQTHHRHVEPLLIGLIVALADRHELLEGDAQLR